MPSAIVTTRKLKNTETGIDINIPVYKEIKGLLQSTWEFYVVVVSNLPYFKSPKHKDSDVVQFMVQKKFADFEALHSKLNEKYPATILPELPRKTLIITETAVKERKVSLEKFLQFITITNKLANSSDFLEFLGVNAIKAGKFRQDFEDDDGSGDKKISETEEENKETGGGFDDGEANEEDVDLFTKNEKKVKADEDALNPFFNDEDEDDTLNPFMSEDQQDTDDTKMFDSPDLGGGLAEGEEDLFFVPGSKEPAIVTKKVKVEDNSDLFNIEDNLDMFLTVKDEKNQQTEKEKQETKEKPVTLSKPAVPSKPKVFSKSESENTKPSVKPKPTLPKKPSKQTDSTISEMNQQPHEAIQSLQTSEILQYIEANAENEEDVDLFS